MIRKVLCINAVALLLLAGFFFIYPSIRAALDMEDPALQKPGVPKAVWRLYRNLTPRYARWAQERVAQGRAATLTVMDISGTEWPPFGSAFYLWGIENLQAAWDGGDHTTGLEPKVYARDAIIAASELVIDPNHASWVKKHWGENYLHKENAFYRMLVIAVLTSRQNLLHDNAHLDMLRDQVETYSRELDASKAGLMEDYPGQCYPGDVMAALMCFQRADAILGTDHSRLINRGLRGFVGRCATRQGLPPYMADSDSGIPSTEARGCANSYMCLTAPELWPKQAMEWYALYDRLFWQERITAVGFREYPKDMAEEDWTLDVDSGPVVAGHGVAASAFGIGATRKNGRFDRAYPLASELLATIGELPNGVLATPRLLSDTSDAPLLGEAAILWQLSIQPQKGFPLKTGGKIPAYTYIVLLGALLVGGVCILKALTAFRKACFGPAPIVWKPRFQLTVWVCLLAGAAAVFVLGHEVAAVALLVPGLMLPVTQRKPARDSYEDWPEAQGEKKPEQEPSKNTPTPHSPPEKG